MQTLKIFLASSSELATDREAFKQFLYDKTILWKDRGIFLEIVRWEEFLDSISRERLQDEYNKAIAGCDVFVVLFFTKVGRYTDEEFEVALKRFKESGKPLVYTYFKDAEITTAQANKEDLTTLWSFQEKLARLGHYYTTYKNTAELLLKFGGQLERIVADYATGQKIIQESQAPDINYHSYLSHLKSLSADNVALQSKIQELSSAISRLDSTNPANKQTDTRHEMNAVLKEIISSLPSVNRSPGQTESSKAGIKGNKVYLAVLSAVAVIVLLFVIVKLMPGAPRAASSNTSVTVFVHGQNGRQDMVLKQQGYVIMDINGERKKELIDDKGKSVFQNVKVGEKVSIDVDFSEPYHAVNRDSLYVINENSPIYLQVKLPNLERVFGRVIYKEAPLQGVVVSIGNTRDTTDVLGKYELHLQQNEQSKRQEVDFFKPGYKMISAVAYPQNAEPLNVVMNK